MAGDARTQALRFYVAITLGVVAVIVAVTLSGRRGRDHRESVPPPDAMADWCAEGLEPIDGGCFAAARETGKPPALLVYLHGRYPPERAPDQLVHQARLARMASARGYAVLALRGMQGQCTDPQLATWWCWPSNERNAGDGPAFVSRWASTLHEAERRVGRARRVLLGFSNGGYFAALIAARALMPFDAVAIAHAGPVEPMSPIRGMPPVLLLDADDDPSGPEMSRLDADLTRESWPHAVAVREGGHALLEWDIDMSLTFFDRVRTERIPLEPPLAARTTRRPTEPDAAPDAPEPPEQED